MPPLTGQEVINYLSENKKLLYDQFGVLRIGVFGSFARGTSSCASDVDIVVELASANKDIHHFLRLKRFLENELKMKVDLGFEHSLKPVVKENIKEQIIYV